MFRILKIFGCTIPAGLAIVALPALAQIAGDSQATVIDVQGNPPGPGARSFVPPQQESADSPVAAARPADPSYHGGPYTGALTPAPASLLGKVYPLCTRVLRDSCVNPVRHNQVAP